MARYTDIGPCRLRELLSRYGRTPVWSQPIAGGAANSSYRVGTTMGETVVVTALDGHDVASAEQLVKTMRRLPERAWVPPAPLVGEDGQTVTATSGVPVIVRPYVDGAVTKHVASGQLHAVGRVLAEVHALPVRHGTPVSSSGVPTICDPGLAVPAEIVEAVQRTAPFVAHLTSGSLPAGFIHGDVFADNLVWPESSDTPVVIDWETAGTGPFLIELSITAAAVCRNPSTFVLERTRLDRLIAGYETVRPLTGIEADLFDEAVQFASADIALSRFLCTIRHPGPVLLDWSEMVPAA